MDPKDSEKMRLELESFLNTCLRQKERAWPLKHLDLLKREGQTRKDSGVFTRDQK